MTSFRRLKIGNFSVAGVCHSRENLKFAVVSAQCRPAAQDTQLALPGSTQLILANLASEQSSSVGPAVESEIFHLFLKLQLFSGSAMQKGHFAPICAHSLTGSLLQWSNNLIYTPTSLVYVKSNHCCQIRSINENRPQNISWGSQMISIISIVLLQTNQVLCYWSS